MYVLELSEGDYNCYHKQIIGISNSIEKAREMAKDWVKRYSPKHNFDIYAVYIEVDQLEKISGFELLESNY